MRPTAEIKKRVTGDIRELNRRLLKLSNRIAVQAQKHQITETPQGRIVIALFKKAVNTFRAIEFLKRERLIEEAWVLLRVLLESHINLLFFLKSDTTEMTRRWADAAILDKLKYLREVRFFQGTPLSHLGRREAWEEAEADIARRYSKDEMIAMRRHGYSGLPVEQRASAVGLLGMYQNCYRIASRSVHTFDPAETAVMDYINDKKYVEDLLSSRRETLESTQNMLLGRLAFLLSEMIGDPLLSLNLMLLGLGYEKYRDKKDGRSTTESETEPDSFYIWRE
jgi:hypothetical protein